MEPTDHHGARKRAARHLVFGERLVPVVRCICIKIGNCCAQILTRLLLKLHDVAQAVVEGDIGQKGVQQLCVDAAAIGFDNLEKREANIVKKRFSLLVEFLVGKLFQVLDAVNELLANARIRNERLRLRGGSIGVRILLYAFVQ